MKIFLMCIWILAMILTYGLLAVLYSTQMIPNLYLIGIGIVFAVILLLILRGMYKKSFTKAISVTCCLAVIGAMTYGTLEFNTILGSLQNMIDKSNTEISAVSVYVLKDSGFESLSEISQGSYGIHSTIERKHVDEVIHDLEKENKIIMDEIPYEDWDQMVRDLYDGKLTAVVINDAYAALLDEDSFIYNTKVLTTSYKEVVKTDISKDVNVTNTPFNVFISGNDIYGSIAYKSRSDVNMVVTVNPKTKQILLTSIPRDYYIDLGCESGSKDKLTHAGIYGVDCSVKTIENLFDIDINYYARVNFSTLINVVDTLGGIEVYSDRSFNSYPDGVAILSGTNVMNGKQALAFSRERHAYAEGDIQRIKNQQTVISAIIKKACSPSIITKASSVLSTISDGVETNMSSDEINSLIKMQLSDMAGWEIISQNVTGDGNTLYCYSLGNNAYVMTPHQDEVDQASLNIQKCVEGTLTREDLEQKAE